ncbi:MAG TPA: peptide chain release factor 1 [Candidatus Caccopulliclostridium gallistercoris]|uniref:Peptide chain release factor 1 n=1 Tax=Candidatus Caccopulliclostridium gallistercoris TaxID=2840719 RepID=A0A9D1NE74_9FIRM|nr:peptide chain release factor 1 [Candidatus Caccopulliclostridium gallistercoris]
MLEKTTKIKQRYDELTDLIVKPEIIADNNEWKKLVKERNSIEDIALAHDKLEKLVKEKEQTESVIANEKDHEMKKLFEDELFEINKNIEKLEEEIKVLLLPKDENDESDVIVEIRAAAGGEESALFGAVLMKMYTRFAERKHWKVEMIDVSETELGGIKEAVFSIKGKNAYKYLKYESGVHRVQRVPETETQGRVHTSTATVAILPEVQDVDFEINDKDIKIDTYRSSGAGGQHVNKTDSAIRITHFPTGIVVACQDERSQIKNRERAMSILKAKLYDYYKTQQDKEYAENRRSQVGTGDRSERIRTYNYPQGRITDHRINYSVYNMDDFLDGDIEEMSDELQREDQKRKLEQAGN